MAAAELRRLPEVWGVHIFPRAEEPSQKWLRCLLFLGVMVAEWAVGCALGTCILMVKARGWFVRPYMGLHEEECAEPTEDAMLLQAQRVSRRVTLPCAICSLVLAIFCAATCELSRDTGLAWEAWAAWVAYICGSHLVQAALLDTSSGPRGYPLNLYTVKTTKALTPLLSEPVDFLKDTALAALLLQEGCRMQGGIGDLAVIVLGTLALGVLYWSAFVYVPDTIDGCAALLEAHAGVLVADAAGGELLPSPEASAADAFWMELYKQVSPGRRRIVLSEDLPQLCIAALGTLLKLGPSPFAIVSMIISALRLACSFAAQLPARREVLPRLALSLESALTEGNKERSQQLIRQLQEEPPDVLNSLALRVVGGLQWPRVFGLCSVLRVARVLRAQAGGVLALSLHPARHRLFSAGGFDGTARVWSVTAEPQELGLLRGHCGDVYALALHPVEPLLFSSGADAGVRVWRSDTLKLLRVLVGHSGSVDALALHPARGLLLSGSSDSCIHVRSCSDPFELIRVLEGHAGRVVSLAPHPEEPLFFSGSFDDSIRVWSLEVYVEKQVLRQHTGSVWALAVHASRRLLVSGSFDSTIRVWSLDNFAVLHVLQRHKGSVLALALHPEVPLLFSGSGDRSVRVWSLDSFSEVQVLRRRAGSVRALVVEPSGGRLFVGSGDGSIIVCELAGLDEAAAAACGAL